MRKAGNTNSGERGAVTIKAVLTLAFLATVIFVTIKIVPVYIQQRELIHEVDEIARRAALGSVGQDRILREIERVRAEYRLPEGSINLSSSGRDAADVALKYNVPIDFFVTTYIWEVDYKATSKGF